MNKNTKTNKKEQKQANLVLMLSFFILILVIPLTSSLPQIQLISQTDPLEYSNIQTIILSITSSTTITQTLIEFDENNHTLEKEDLYYKYSWIPAHKGTNIYKIYAKDLLNETKNYTNTFLVQDTIPPKIIETRPQGILNYNLIELKAITNENSTCKYDEADVSHDSMKFIFTGKGTIHTALRSFGDAEYFFYVKCKDPENNVGQSQNISFKVDTTPPKISKVQPTGTVTQAQITLRFNTNEIAICKWGKTNEEYNYLDNQFQTTGGTLHEQPLSLIEGINAYYLSCKDQLENKNPTITLNLELNLPPTASISVHKNNSYKALRKGTYEVSLTTSEPLSPTPDLKLKYRNKIINVPLEGSSENWEGYLIIPENIGEEVGEFLYTGKDTKGTTGTEITSGKLALLDTTPPRAPKYIRLLNENNKIKISWDYEGEETDHFKIYRSVTGNTDKSDLKTTTQETYYLDADVTNKIGYFYRISAVDQAGNQGPLSEEEFIMTEYQNASPGFKQDPELLAIINTNIAHIEKMVQNLEVKITELEETTDQDLLQIINEQELVSKQKEIKNKIQTLVGELKTYRETKLTKDELNTKIAVISKKIAEYQKDVIKEVKIKSKVQTEQIVDEGLVQKAVEEYLKNKVLTQEQRGEYYTRTRNLQEQVRILQDLISYEIEYEYKESEKITLIKEILLAPQELRGILIQEFIPKDVIKISEIIFTTTPSELNTIGVLWLLRELENSEVRYTTLSEKDLNQLQMIRTILLYDIDEFLNVLSEEKLNASSQITGEAVAKQKQGFSLTKMVLVPIGIIIVIALIIYYFVFLKTQSVYEREIIENIDMQEQQSLRKLKVPVKRSDNVSEVRTIVSVSKSDLDILLGFIQKAYEGLEHSDIDNAYKNYSQALSHYSHAKLNLKHRLKVNFEMNTLYDKIVETKKPS